MSRPSHSQCENPPSLTKYDKHNQFKFRDNSLRYVFIYLRFRNTGEQWRQCQHDSAFNCCAVMNTATYIVCGMEVVMCKLEGETARTLECRMWVFMFTEGETAKFPHLQEIMDFKHYRHTGDKRKFSYIERSCMFPAESHIVTDKSVSPNSIYLLFEKRVR